MKKSGNKLRQKRDEQQTGSGDVAEDNRFSAMHSSKLFKKVGSDKRKVKLDSRFKGVLTDDKFRVEPGVVDKYGRKKTKTAARKQAEKELSEFYDIEENDDEHENATAEKEQEEDDDEQVQSGSESGVGEDDEDDDKKDDNQKETAESRLDFLNRFARGDYEGSSSSDEAESDDDTNSESDSDSDRSALSDTEIKEDDRFNLSHGPLAIPDDDEEEIEEIEPTKRIALQNCDWENIKAVDLHVILQSFSPTGGEIKSVIIYLSDFGKERIEAETKYGPQWLWDESLVKNTTSTGAASATASGIRTVHGNSEGDFERKDGFVGVVIDDTYADDDLDIINPKDGNDKGTKVKPTLSAAEASEQKELQNVLLRRYELSKLRYYFAIAECDSVATANAIYEQLDGVEMESSSMVFDLRFVPDDITFTGREVKERSDKDKFNLEVYEAPSFVVSALQQSNLECSWDQDRDKERKLTNISMWRKLKEDDLMQYIASSDSSDGDSDEDEESNGKKKKGSSSKKSSNSIKDEVKNSKQDSKAKKAKDMRKLLLGDLAEDDDEEGQGQAEDDFFLADEDDSNHYEMEQTAEGEDDDDEQFGEKTMTYVPDADDAEDEDDEVESKQQLTPFEQLKQKLAEKKKAKKLAKKQSQQLPTDDESEQEQRGSKSKDKSKAKGKTSNKSAEDPGERNGELELLFAGEEEDPNDYDMRELHKADKLSGKKKGKKNMKGTGSNGDSFAVDLSDERFSALLSKDGRFGIDTTSTEFKAKDTKEMKRLLAAQRTVSTAAVRSSSSLTPQAEGEYRLLSTSASIGKEAEETFPNDDCMTSKRSASDSASALADRLKKKFKK